MWGKNGESKEGVKQEGKVSVKINAVIHVNPRHPPCLHRFTTGTPGTELSFDNG